MQDPSPGQLLEKGRFRLLNRSLFGAQVLLYERALTFKGWSLRGTYKQTFWLDTIKEIEWWEGKHDCNFALKFSNGKEMGLWMRGAGRWKFQIDEQRRAILKDRSMGSTSKKELSINCVPSSISRYVARTCPNCQATNIIKNGFDHKERFKYTCKRCSKKFVANPSDKCISQATKDLIDRLLREKLPLAGIVRVTGISERWLQNYINEKYGSTLRQIDLKSGSSKRSTKKRHLPIECDEKEAFVGKRTCKQWVWLALDRDMCQVMGVHVGAPDEAGVRGLGHRYRRRIARMRWSRATLGRPMRL